MKQLCILMSALLIGCSITLSAKKSKAVEEGMPESLPMKKLDSATNVFSSNPIELHQTLATPSTEVRTSIAPASAQDINDRMAEGITDSLIRIHKIRIDPELKVKEKEIKALFDTLLTTDTHNEERLEINSRIFKKFREALGKKGSFFYPFDSLKNIGRIYSDDYNLRVYTWCVELEDLNYHFYGFIQDLETDRIYALEQNGAVYIPRETQQILPRRWYGALYYKIIRLSKGDDMQYVALGWSQPNPNMKMKVIDVFDFSGDKLMLGGDETFKSYRGKVGRVVFTYCSNLGMTLQYDEKKKRFVFDHVTPLADANGNATGCNGPDMSYDELKRKGKRFILKKDVDMMNEE